MYGPYSSWAEQRILEIKGWKLGGFPGENPTWLIGSMFYHGDKILHDTSGAFDRAKAREKLEEAISIAEEHGLVFGLDVVFPSLESVEPIMSFVSEYNIPLFLDSPDPAARMKSYRVTRELGVNDRSIANGLFTDSPEEEAEEIRDNGLAAAVLMAFDPRDAAGSIDPESRIKLLEERLLPVARRAGLSNLIVDSIVIDPASISLSAETVYMVKEKYGFPSGCAPANALGPVSKKAVGLEGMYSVHGGVAVYLRVMGSDFIMYGPVQRIKYIASAVAMADSLLGYSLRHHGARIGRSHPLRKYLRRIQKLFVSTG